MENMQDLLALPREEQVEQMMQLCQECSDAELAERWGVSLNRIRAYRKKLGIQKGSGGRQPQMLAHTESQVDESMGAPSQNLSIGVEGTSTGQEILRFLENIRPLPERVTGAMNYSFHINSGQ